MENNFYRDDFEQMLREKADEFKLQPGRRVWRSIYNNMHPSRKWPSVMISLLLITSLVFVGYLNTDNEDNTLTTYNLQDKLNTGITSGSNATPGRTGLMNNDNQADSKNISSTEKSNPNNQPPLLTAENIIADNKNTRQRNIQGIDRNDPFPLAEQRVVNGKQKTTAGNTMLTTAESNAASDQTENNLSEIREPVSETTALDATSVEKAGLIAAITTSNPTTTTIKSNTADNDKAWIEHFAFYNKSNRKKWKDRMAYAYYVSPGISYRMLKSNIKYNLPVNAVSGTGTETYPINQIPSLSAEIGATMIYSFAKNIRLKAGLQFNYTSYGIKAYETNHPILTTLTLNDLNSGYPYLESRNTSIANISSVGGTTLHNKTYQVSLPVGLEYKLAGKDKLQWYAGVTAQPTYIISGKSYLLSSDNKNYIADNSMIRKWSFNTGIETFISFKTMHGTTIQIGPQVRLQVPSTYGKKYSMDEKLFSAGMKFGVVRNF